MRQAPEFVDSLSDDLIYLNQAYEALLNHPTKKICTKLCDAWMCRMYSILTVMEVEHMISLWKSSRDAPSALADYGKSWDRNLQVLQDCIPTLLSGSGFDRDVVSDFVAIKLLRNRIIHSNEEAKKFVQKRGFPSDVRDLDGSHLERIQEVEMKMKAYLIEPSIKATIEAESSK